MDPVLQSLPDREVNLQAGPAAEIQHPGALNQEAWPENPGNHRAYPTAAVGQDAKSLDSTKKTIRCNKRIQKSFRTQNKQKSLAFLYSNNKSLKKK